MHIQIFNNQALELAAGTNQNYLRSDTGVKTNLAELKQILPNNLSNKHIDIVACQSNYFGKELTNTLANNKEFKCDGLTLSSRRHDTY